METFELRFAFNVQKDIKAARSECKRLREMRFVFDSENTCGCHRQYTVTQGTVEVERHKHPSCSGKCED